MPVHDKPLFFIHVMKTAGTNLKWRFRMNLEASEVFPNEHDDNLVQANTSIDYLTSLSAERKARTRVYSGHFPYIAVEMLGIPCYTMTVLRDPVERVVSHLRQVRRNKTGWVRFSEDLVGVEDPTFEQLYDDPFLRPRFFVDHQVRVFSLGLDDDPKTYVDLFDIDEARVETAKHNLDKVDEVGLTDDYAGFEQRLIDRFGISGKELPKLQTAPPDQTDVSHELRERIREDNAHDLAFFEFATDLVERRRTASG